MLTTDRVEIADDGGREAVHGHRVDHELDGGLVVEQHDRVQISARRAALEEFLRGQQRIPIAFQPRRRPRQIQQQRFQHAARVSAGRLLALHAAFVGQGLGQSRRQQGALVRDVVVHEAALIAHRCARC
ncbi:hypothetical protein G6F55_014236 [Rhizopus delemar]|nr:hypothetical protein G6F55_014236 [Rhizopus delemar]